MAEPDQVLGRVFGAGTQIETGNRAGHAGHRRADGDRWNTRLGQYRRALISHPQIKEYETIDSAAAGKAEIEFTFGFAVGRRCDQEAVAGNCCRFAKTGQNLGGGWVGEPARNTGGDDAEGVRAGAEGAGTVVGLVAKLGHSG